MTNPAQDGRALENALEIGYRHFDTAYKYQNEEIVGQAFKKWIDAGKGQRKDLFVVTKVYTERKYVLGRETLHKK